MGSTQSTWESSPKSLEKWTWMYLISKFLATFARSLSLLGQIIDVILTSLMTEEITHDEEEDVKENTLANSCLFQCEICGDALTGKDAIEAHVDSLHMYIVEELEETVSDFYVILPDPSLISSGDDLTAEEIAQIYLSDKELKQMTSQRSLKRRSSSKKSAKIRS